MSEEGGRVFFSGAARSLIEEDVIELTSVGVDIGSATSHLLFSRITLERSDQRYEIASREVLHESAILLTPYHDGADIDQGALASFVESEYAAAGLARSDVDAGALILTGVAVRRRNARAIGEVFAAEAGRFVALSAGDALETLMAAHGSGAAALSAEGPPVLALDVGGGTTKIALCARGEPVSMTALDAGARLVVTDEGGRITGLEPFGARYLAAAGVSAGIGDKLPEPARQAVAGLMADKVMEAAGGGDVPGFLRLPPLSRDTVPAFFAPQISPPEAPARRPAPGRVVFSGGVSEYLDGRTAARYGDLGPELAQALLVRIRAAGLTVVPARAGIRATVLGAAQYTVQVSGSTIYFDPEDALPLHDLPVIAPALDLGETIGLGVVAAAVAAALDRLDLAGGERAVAVAMPWQGSASFARLRGLARGLLAGLARHLASGHPLVLVLDGDVGGLLGVHLRAEEGFAGPIVSIDGVRLSEFDFIDIGEVLRSTGAAPVVVKSLVFPTA